MIDTIYPVGIVVPFGNSTNPNAVFGGTWEKVAEGRTLQGADSNHAVGSTVEAGLPDINGEIYVTTPWGGPSASGAFKIKEIGGASFESGGRGNSSRYSFSANASSNIYGASNTVQPPAYIVVWWQRTA